MAKRREENKHKPIIETIINSSALALTAWGVTNIMNRDWYGFTALSFGVLLEYFKYRGRKNKLW